MSPNCYDTKICIAVIPVARLLILNYYLNTKKSNTTMNYKLPKPEDYPEIEGYQFKLSHAYAELYGMTMGLLMRAEKVNESLDEDDIETAKFWLNAMFDEFKQP